MAPLLQLRDLRGVGIDADHVVTEVGEAGAGDEPDIAGADHRYPHDESLPLSAPATGAPLIARSEHYFTSAGGTE